MRAGRRDADIPGMLCPGGRGMPERGEFQDGEGRPRPAATLGREITQPASGIADGPHGFNRRPFTRGGQRPKILNPFADNSSYVIRILSVKNQIVSPLH